MDPDAKYSNRDGVPFEMALVETSELPAVGLRAPARQPVEIAPNRGPIPLAGWMVE